VSTRSSKLTGSSGAVFDYLTDPDAVLDYYGDNEMPFTQVWGKGAATLGIERGITKEQFKELFSGRWDGEQLARQGYRKVTNPDGTEETVLTRTPMIDFVYGAPKSVAVLYVQASPEFRQKLDAVMLQAAHAAHDAMESSAKFARVPVKTPAEVGARTTKQQGSDTKRVTADLIALPVVQYTARPTEESEKRGVPDPQIHVHVPIFTLCQAEGRWYTADEFGAKNRANAKYRDAVFIGELARGLESLGVELKYNEFDRAKNGEVRWEVADSDPELRKYWSTNNERAWKIRREYEERHGKPIDEVKLGEILYKTRKHKTAAVKQQDSHPNWDLWRDDAQRAGFKMNRVEQAQPIEHSAFRAADRLRLRLLGANGLCSDNAVFDEASIRPAIARCAVGLGFSPAELDGLERVMLGPDGRDLVLVRDGAEPEDRLFTTNSLLEAERDTATTLDRKNSAGHLVHKTGRAGTGKSFAAGVAVEALHSLAAKKEHYDSRSIQVDSSPVAEAVKAAVANREHAPDEEQMEAIRAIVKAGRGCNSVIVTSMAASTAERTGLKVQADAWGSVESVTSRIEKGTLRADSKTLCIIEEAGQLDTLRADKLLKAVGDARIVTLGDTRQLSAIGGAGWYADALARHGSIELTEVRRQKDQRDVEDYALVRDGQSNEALGNLAERGRLHVAASDGDRFADVFSDYHGHREQGRLARDIRIVLDSSNQDVDTANRFVQRDRLSRGEISPTSAVVESEDQGRRWALHENDQIIMLSSVRVRGEDPVKNGTSGVVRKLDLDRNRVRVRLEDDREVNLPLSASIGLSYAVHIQKFQGGEAPVALVVPGRNTSRNAGYTSLTRGVEESHVYVSDEAGGVSALAERWATVNEKVSATTTIEQLRREEQVMELPPLRSDELDLDDIALDPIPDLDPVRGFELPRDDDLDPFKPERLVEPSLEQDLNGPELEF
jgi:conjugative relaxase-like TrwC/TraI family protein